MSFRVNDGGPGASRNRGAGYQSRMRRVASEDLFFGNRSFSHPSGTTIRFHGCSYMLQNPEVLVEMLIEISFI